MRKAHPRLSPASTEDQEASRAQSSLDQFVSEHNKVIASVYLGNASGASAKRPELLRAVKDARKGDVRKRQANSPSELQL
ncbi:recombinase family protein [Pseudomonas saxonica]|uniref:Uncharacterized protein n=1 Tax=Pseudomonas saxonica TaxID=2600598 RepID=A0A5C5PX80_9PSED|nr:hypothetical protein FJD37_11275 [Pseudomonas saxonica]